MHKTDRGSRHRHSFEAQAYKRADVAADRIQWDMAGGKIGRVQRAFAAASGDCNDTAEDWGALEEREEVDNKAEARVVPQGG